MQQGCHERGVRRQGTRTRDRPQPFAGRCAEWRLRLAASPRFVDQQGAAEAEATRIDGTFAWRCRRRLHGLAFAAAPWAYDQRRDERAERDACHTRIGPVSDSRAARSRRAGMAARAREAPIARARPRGTRLHGVARPPSTARRSFPCRNRSRSSCSQRHLHPVLQTEKQSPCQPRDRLRPSRSSGGRRSSGTFFG